MKRGWIFRSTIRIWLTVILLAIVWRHSHWSVALAITLQGIAIEIWAWCRAIEKFDE